MAIPSTYLAKIFCYLQSANDEKAALLSVLVNTSYHRFTEWNAMFTSHVWYFTDLALFLSLRCPGFDVLNTKRLFTSVLYCRIV